MVLFPTDLFEMVLDEGRDVSEVLEGVGAPTASLAGLGLEEGGERIHGSPTTTVEMLTIGRRRRGMDRRVFGRGRRRRRKLERESREGDEDATTLSRKHQILICLYLQRIKSKPWGKIPEVSGVFYPGGLHFRFYPTNE